MSVQDRGLLKELTKEGYLLGSNLQVNEAFNDPPVDFQALTDTEFILGNDAEFMTGTFDAANGSTVNAHYSLAAATVESWPTMIAVSPDGDYVAALVQGAETTDIEIVDVSDRANPSQASLLTGVGQVYGLNWYGNDRIVANEVGMEGSASFYSIDVSDKTSPSVDTSINIPAGYDSAPIYAYESFPSDDGVVLTAFSTNVGADGAGVLIMIDMADPTAPVMNTLMPMHVTSASSVEYDEDTESLYVIGVESSGYYTTGGEPIAQDGGQIMTDGGTMTGGIAIERFRRSDGNFAQFGGHSGDSGNMTLPDDGAASVPFIKDRVVSTGFIAPMGEGGSGTFVEVSVGDDNLYFSAGMGGIGYARKDPFFENGVEDISRFGTWGLTSAVHYNSTDGTVHAISGTPDGAVIGEWSLSPSGQ